MEKQKIRIFFKMAISRIVIITLPFLFLGGIVSFFNYFISNGEYVLNIAIFLLICAIILSFLEGRFFARAFFKHEIKITSKLIQINVILLILTTLTYILLNDFSIETTKVLFIIFNPFHVLHVVFMSTYFEQGMFTIIFTSVIVSNLTFMLYSRKIHRKVNSENKLQFTRIDKLAFIGFAVIGVTGMTINCMNSIPEIEYINMQKKFEALQFDEFQDDYDFFQKVPFAGNDSLATLSNPPTLVFDDVDTSPRLDGATAFYPIYSSYVQNIYHGFGQYVKDNGYVSKYTYFINPSNDWGINVYPYQDIISCTKTDVAYERLLEKKVDVIFAFEPSMQQLKSFADAGEELEMTKIGYDGFTFFVSVENQVDSLSVDQVQKMYTGQIKNWKKVGGANKRVFAFQRPEGSGSQTIMENLVMKGKKINSKYKAQTVRTMGGMINVIGGYLNADNAIGYTFMYYSSSMVTSNQIKYLSIDGVYPSPESLRSGSYIFTTPFYAISLKSNKSQEVKDLLTWVTGEQGQELLIKTGYVGL